ncbi:hypothetical protein ABN034_07670 [Actinopolymorpha sp. B11F2]|uniref:hypothetical protein n=1 Tax=Actinopolymorpha sp. B11F2 TaxID=3160862 RepID=UPI0032E419B3
MEENAARHHLIPLGEDRNAFKYLLLLCLTCHAEVDDKTTGETLYPPERLIQMKAAHEGRNGAALASLGSIGDEQLTDLLLEVFTPPIDRLRTIAEQLERTGVASADTVAELKQLVTILGESFPGPDARTANSLAYAAEVFSGIRLRDAATALASAADSFSGMRLDRTAKELRSAASEMINASEQARGWQ